MLILGQVIHAKKPEGDPLVNGLIMKAVQQCLVLHSPMGDIQHKGNRAYRDLLVSYAQKQKPASRRLLFFLTAMRE